MVSQARTDAWASCSPMTNASPPRHYNQQQHHGRRRYGVQQRLTCSFSKLSPGLTGESPLVCSHCCDMMEDDELPTSCSSLYDRTTLPHSR